MSFLNEANRTCLDSSKFEENLQNSMVYMKNRHFGDFWLNKNGTISPKSSWLGRIVRWFINLFKDKTLTDIWAVLKRVLSDYEQTIDEVYISSFYKSINSIQMTEGVTKCVSKLHFVLEFLMSRKEKFDSWIKNKPENLKLLNLCRKKFNPSKTNSLIPVDLMSMDKIHVLFENLYYSHLNKTMLKKKPQPIKLSISPEIQPNVYNNIQIDKLLSIYKAFKPNETNDHSESFGDLIKKVKLRDPEVFGINSKIQNKYYDQIEVFLKNILYEIQTNKTLSEHKIHSVLQELALASKECGARWIEESKKQFQAIKSHESFHAEHLILEDFQNLKEDLFLELFQNVSGHQVEFHILNSFKKKYGAELGLDQSTLELDMFQYKLSTKGLDKLLAIFLSKCIPRRIVHGLTQRINLKLAESYEPAYFCYLAQRVSKKYPEVNDVSNFVMHTFMKKNKTQINNRGVAFLLEEMEILKR